MRMSPEKIIIIICLFAGFYWIRSRSRQVNLESRMLKSILGVFVLLPASLLGEKFLFEKFHFGAWQDLVIKVAILIATFLIIGFGFLSSSSGSNSSRPS